jgi:hypothetical protein
MGIEKLSWQKQFVLFFVLEIIGLGLYYLFGTVPFFEFKIGSWFDLISMIQFLAIIVFFLGMYNMIKAGIQKLRRKRKTF